MAVADTLLRNDKLRKITLERVEKYLSEECWTDVNLFSRLYSRTLPSALTLEVWSPPGEVDVNRTDRTTYAEAAAAEYRPAKVGDTFGPSWATHWFRVTIAVPEDVQGEELHLIWNNSSEALLWKDGSPVQSFYGGNGDDKRIEYILTKNSQGGETFELFIEMACNGLFGVPADGGFLNPPDAAKTFALKAAHVAVLHRTAFRLYWDMATILGAAKELSGKSARAWQAANCLERMINTCYADDDASMKEALAIGAEFLSQTNGSSAHEVIACGHCHIDTAWLWTYSETRRKVARSWATQLELMTHYPGYTFTASQAQQFEWLEQNYPPLFKRLQEAVKAGTFYPAGGTWVEMDCNIPSGESLVRQFLFGQEYFRAAFGTLCTEFWLPDTFGYSAQLPQIMKESGITRFLTQKLSWNLVNKFPHNTFHWEGLDGTKVLAHFPPADTYCARGTVKELLYTESNFKNKGTSNSSMMLFGIGDGGGGPQLQMLERLTRCRDLDRVPRVVFASPAEYFARAERETQHPVWVGELYFELHRGTYTTHSAVKRGNRKNEFLLHDVEFLGAVAAIANKAYRYPREEMDRLWKLLLLNQFHDVIPGTSIGPVYNDTREHYADIAASGARLLASALAALGLTAPAPLSAVAVNSVSWARREVVALPDTVAIDGAAQSGFAVVEVPSLGWSSSLSFSVEPESAVTVRAASDGAVVLENALIRAVVAPAAHSSNGTVRSLVHKASGRESIAAEGGNRFVLHEDMPFFWDAWDAMEYHVDKKKYVQEVCEPVTIVDSGPLAASLRFSIALSKDSKLIQTIRLNALSEYLEFDTFVDWHENRKFLKVEFDVPVRSEHATYSIQYGHVRRPTHRNTAWDVAKFEVAAQHWMDLSEFGFGVALLSDCKYGFACLGSAMTLSLLRSPKQPDDTADMGTHLMKYALLPHKGEFTQSSVLKQGYNFNSPLIIVPGKAAPYSFCEVSAENVAVEVVKPPQEVQSGATEVVLRVWETFGGRADCTLTLPHNLSAVKRYSKNGRFLPH